MRGSVRWTAAVLVMGVGAWAGARLMAEGGAAAGAVAATGAAVPGDDVVYEDAGAGSSATVTEVLPDSKTSQVTLENVRRIRVKGEVFIIEWGGTSTTLLPRQFVESININKRAAAASASGPAGAGLR